MLITLSLARFVVADEVTYNAVLQLAARYRFECGKELRLRIAKMNNRSEKLKFDEFVF